METLPTPQTEPATEEQLLQAGRYFSDLLRKTVDTKGGVQLVLDNFAPMIAPRFRPILLHASRQIIVRNASRLDLLVECQAAGIPLGGSTPKGANYGRTDPRADYEVLNYDLDRIFSRRVAGQLPWGGNKARQESWAKGGICSVQQALQAVMDYHSVHGHVPDPRDYWWLRCSDPDGFEYSLGVYWSPDYGLSVDYVSYVSSTEYGGCLSREVP